MQAIFYFLALPFLYLLSILPFPVLYLVSDLLYLLLFKTLAYRKKVVLTNLHNAFPGKSEQEYSILVKKYYRYLCDLFLETFKTLTISKKSMLKHCHLHPEALSLFQRYHAEGKSVIIVMGHYGNWEWAGNTFSLTCPQQLYVIYHPLRNKWFNGLLYRMRTRFGTKLYAMSDTFKEMVRNRKETSATAFIADQTPSPENAYWTEFLNQDTPVFWGTEKIASKMGYAVVYVSIDRTKRGYYTVYAETLFENPSGTQDGQISESHTRRLEKDIIKKPELWLWSHRRWKHKRPVLPAG
ncbi:MAG: lysophospholipid acyltransferase family protein [Flavobacteriales bacterium]